MSAETRWYALVDGASDPAIRGMALAAREHACLFSGRLADDLAAVSPYLVAIDPNEPLLPAWQARGQGRHWGIMIESDLSFEALRRHVRRFLQVRLPDGEVVLFRFWDPRVFRGFIRHAPPAQQAGWFDGVRQYAVEGEDGVQHSFRLRGGRLFDGDRQVEQAA